VPDIETSPPPDSTFASDKTAVPPSNSATVAIEKNDDGYRLAADTPTMATSGGKSGSNRTAMGTQAGKPTGADSSRGTEATHVSSAGTSSKGGPPAKVTQFTTVSVHDLHGRRERDGNARWQWVGLATLCAAAVFLLAGIAYYTTRSPSADRLYAKIEAAGASGDAIQLAEVEPDLTSFLKLYAADARAGEVQGYLDDLERSRVQRRFELRARRPGGAEGLSPIERAYLEAVQLTATDPEEALARFGALVAVYGGSFGEKQKSLEQRNDSQCLELAEKQVARLRPAVQRMNAEQQQEIRRQLERAEQLAGSDRTSAVKIWQGIVTLYGGKLWARELVAEAQGKLARQSTGSH